MRLVNEKLGCGDSGNVLNEGVIAFHGLHTVDEDTGVRDEDYLTAAQIMLRTKLSVLLVIILGMM